MMNSSYLSTKYSFPSTATPSTAPIEDQKTSLTQASFNGLEVTILDGCSNHWLTDAAIKRGLSGMASLALLTSSIASYAFMGSIACTTGIVGATLLPIGFACAAGAIAWRALSIRDYDNSQEVAGYREECKSLTLEQAFTKHGKWIYDRKLLSQEQITEKYLQEVTSFKHIPNLEKFHFGLETLLKGSSFSLPSIKSSWERFSKECKTLSLKEIIFKHELQNLFRWELISPKDFQEKYIAEENCLRGLPEIFRFYQEIEGARYMFDAHQVYNTPTPVRLQKKIQEDCKTMSFKEIIDLHSLEYLFSFSLLSPESFSKKYLEHMECLFAKEGIYPVISNYKKTLAARNTFANQSFEIPHPKILQKRWMEQSIALADLMSEGSIGELITYGILQDQKYIETLRKLGDSYLETKENFSKKTSQTEARYKEALKKAYDQFEKDKEIVRIGKSAISQKEAEQKRRIRDIEQELLIAYSNGDAPAVERLRTQLNNLKTWKGFENFFTDLTDEKALNKHLFEAEKSHLKAINDAQKARQEDLAILEKDFNSTMRLLEIQHTIAREQVKK